jgi:chromatin segregation and condensation protein Rec8/ScpA/Scc1 (kleisin family)
VVDEVASEVPVAEEVYIAPEFRLPLVRRPRARMSVADLRRALAAALAQGKRRRPRQALAPEDLGMDLEEEPFSKRALRLMRKLLSLVNGNRVIPLRKLVKRGDPREQVARFMELLHLDAEGKVRLFQEEFLGEVLIEVPRGTESAG